LKNFSDIADLAKKAGALALRSFGKAKATVKADFSYITETDKAVEGFLREELQKKFPGDGILGEEESHHAAHLQELRTKERVWVIDPIDGTTAYATRQSGWCICIGLLQQGHPVAGCIYVPIGDWMFFCDLEGPATLNGEQINAAAEATVDSNTQMVVHSDAHIFYNISFPGKVRSYGSTAYHFCLVASGNLTNIVLAQTAPAYLWDIAAAAAIAERAGAEVLCYSGKPVDYSTLLAAQRSPEALIVVPKGRFKELRSYLTAKI
jgi:myo-inositol-1(or 4)-monophosphatase